MQSICIVSDIWRDFFYLFIFHLYTYVFVDIYESYDKIYMTYKSYLTRNNNSIGYNTVIGI